MIHFTETLLNIFIWNRTFYFIFCYYIILYYSIPWVLLYLIYFSVKQHDSECGIAFTLQFIEQEINIEWYLTFRLNLTS